MATGVPVVSTDVGSVADVVTHGVSGFLAPARDAATLAEHLRTLGGEPLLRVAMGDRGRARVVDDLSEAAMADRYAALFDNALGGTLRPHSSRAGNSVASPPRRVDAGRGGAP
jgi:glycosyltransferase involved in cell wall biosynthesis